MVFIYTHLENIAGMTSGRVSEVGHGEGGHIAYYFAVCEMQAGLAFANERGLCDHGEGCCCSIGKFQVDNLRIKLLLVE